MNVAFFSLCCDFFVDNKLGDNFGIKQINSNIFVTCLKVNVNNKKEHGEIVSKAKRWNLNGKAFEWDLMEVKEGSFA